MDCYHLRAIILKLQHRLSDDDRRRLHFYFGNDVPRRIRDDPTLSGTLCLMESLFDQDKINERDFTFLIKAFEEIQCIDAVKLLREHMRRIQSNGLNQSIQSLGSIMPPMIDQLLRDQDEDQYAMQNLLINQQSNVSGNNSMMIDSNNTNINPVTVIVGNQPSRSKRKQLFNVSLVEQKYLLLLVLLLIIALGITVAICIYRNHGLKDRLNMKDKIIVEEQRKNNQSIQQLNQQLKDLEEEKNELFAKFGQKFGGTGGSHFDDSSTENFTCSHFLSEIFLQYYHDDPNLLNSIRFRYSSSHENQSTIEAGVCGAEQTSKNLQRFALDTDEKIYKVRGNFRNVTLHNEQSIPIYWPILITRVQFFTTKHRVFPSYTRVRDEGQNFTEQFGGYTLGYVTGRSGQYIDQLQFVWYRTGRVF